MSNDPYSSPNAPYAAPSTPGIPVQQPGAPFSTPGAGARRTGLLVLGIVLLVAGVGAGVAMLLASSSAYDEAVEDLARAPVGCTTRLDFDKTGTFTIYVETKGSAGDPGGDCPNNEQDYERESDELPAVDLTLVNEDGDTIDLDDDDGKSYDAADSSGESIYSVEIEDAGRYLLTVTSPDDDFAIAVGKNPKESADSLKTISYILIAAGVVLGAVLIVLGLRRKPASTTGSGGVGAPVTYYPEQQPPSAYTPTGTHAPAAPAHGGGGFAPPSPTPPASSPPPTQQFPAPQWPAPPKP